MGEARILLRDAADLTATVPAEVERKLTVLELLWNDGFVRKDGDHSSFSPPRGKSTAPSSTIRCCFRPSTTRS